MSEISKAQGVISQANKKSWRNPWFIGIIAVVVTALLVNSMLFWYAYHNKSTLVDHEYSTKDRKSDTETIDDIQAHNALAWKTTIKLPKTVVLNVPAAYEIDVTDKQGVPVTGEMEVVAYRPSDAEKDFVTNFKEISSGSYQGYISFPLKGYWELRIRVKRDKEIFETES